MIRYKVRDKNNVTLKTSGTLLNLMSESTFLIKAVYDELKEKDEAAADLYKNAVQVAIRNDESSVWSNE